MNAKYALAIFLVLQVSFSLSSAQPDAELTAKYLGLKNKFLGRLRAAFAKLEASLPDSAHVDQIKGQITGYAEQGKEAVAPALEKAELTLLGLYSYYLRPHIGPELDQAINTLKVYLDEYLPSDQ